MEKNIYIYGIKTGDKFHYIGKTNNKLNTNGNINRSDMSMLYLYDKFRNIFNNNEKVEIVPIKTSDDQWYDQKLKEVVEKYSQNHPLINSQWMLDGKHGYWSDKKRDDNTLKRLSESKYIRIVEYDINGNLIKIWDSCKDVGINVFKDYKVVNGSSDSRIYRVIDSAKVQTRLAHGSYWFRESELMKEFGLIPKRIKISAIAEAQKLRKIESRKKSKTPEFISKYSVIHYNPDMTIKTTYKCSEEAAYMLRKGLNTIRKICRGIIHANNENYILRYGEKSLQPQDFKYPEYTIEPVEPTPKIKEVKVKEPKLPKPKTRTNMTVVEFDDNNNIIRRFDSYKEASEFYGYTPARIRQICLKKYRKKLNLRTDGKKQVIINQ